MTIAFYCRVSSRNQKNDAREAEINKWLVGHDRDQAGGRWFMRTKTGKSPNDGLSPGCMRSSPSGR